MRVVLVPVLLVTLAAGTAAAQLAPERSVVPTPRPEAAEPEAGRDGDSAAAASGEAEAGAGARTPAAAEPGTDGDADAGGAAEEGAGGAEAEATPEDAADEAEAEPHEAGAAAEAAPPVPQLLAESELELGRCLGRLEGFGTVFEQGTPISEEGGECGIANPVRVSEIVPGVALSPPAIMRCATAAAMAEWIAAFALPASALLPGRGRLVEVTQGTAYLCRGINNAEGSLSEHAFGNAVDVMGFRFADGSPIPVEPREREGTPAEAYQRTVRAAACLSFTTVLGPGEEAHDDHLHLDIKARKGGFRLCQ